MPVTAFKEKRSFYERDALDWYVEPAWCTELLLKRVSFELVWDPACGCGTIVRTCRNCNINAIGTDIIKRGDLTLYAANNPELDFLRNAAIDNIMWTDIITNPPYKLAETFVYRGIALRARKIAVLVRLDFLASQKRHQLFSEYPPTLVLVLSRRPSMPPGEKLGKIKASGGQHDFCWIVWDFDHIAEPYTQLDWIL